MTDERKPRIARGIGPFLGFVLFTAALDVYAGNQLQTHSPVSVAAISFTLAAVFFLGGNMARRGVTAALSPLRTHRYDVIAINVTTAVTWLSMLFALKYLEPAVVNVVSLAIGPIVAVLLSPLLRRSSSVLVAEIAVSLGICALIGILVWGSFTGRSGIADLGTDHALLGVLLTLIAGVGMVANVMYSKRLSEAGLGPQSVLAVRFFLMLAVTWVIVAMIDKPGLVSAFLPSAIIAVIGVALPMYLLQVGIKYTEPITVSILLTLSPLFAYLLQLLDRRLLPSTLTLIGIVGIIALVVIGIVERSRHDMRSCGRAQASHRSEARRDQPTEKLGTEEVTI